MRLAFVTIAFALTMPANASYDASAGKPASKPLPTYCEMGRCYVQTVEAIDPVLFGPNAVLFRVESQNWEGSPDTKTLKRAANSASYVLCSKKAPATVEQMSKKSFLVSFLKPNDGSSYFHSNETALYMYFSVCHARFFGSKLDSEGPSFAKSLGYDVHPREGQPTVDNLNSVMDFAK